MKNQENIRSSRNEALRSAVTESIDDRIANRSSLVTNNLSSSGAGE
jgi:hypothetical protein